MMSGFAALKGAEPQSARDEGREAPDEEKKKLRDAAREANRIHCKQTRDRRRERERDLGQEVELLKLYQSIVEEGPDLFSLHRPTADAPFSYLCENFFTRLQLAPEQMLGSSLYSIVDARDAISLRNAIFEVLHQAQQQTHLAPLAGGGGGGGGGAYGGGYGGSGLVGSGYGGGGGGGGGGGSSYGGSGGGFSGGGSGHGGGGGGGTGSSGSLIHVHVIHGKISREASMSIVIGSHGLVVVTRLYDS